MAKIVRNLFKLIFTLAGIALAVIAFAFLFTPFISSSSPEVLGITAVFSITGFNLAFNGEGLFGIVSDGELVDGTSFDFTMDKSIGTQIAIYLLIAGALFALIYLIFCWGRTGAKVKKVIGGLSALVLIVAAVLFFLTVPMSGMEDVEIESYKLSEVSLAFGSIISGAASALGGISMAIASFLGPKER